MLSARKQKMSEEVPLDHSSLPPSGFGKVLTSLQGLQQRLDDFSVEDVGHAHSQAVDLIQQLADLQARLERLQRLHRFFGTARTAIEALARIDLSAFETDADGLERHPNLRAIVRAGKFIEKHPHLLDAQTTADLNSTKSTRQDPTTLHSSVAVSGHSQTASERPDQSFPRSPVDTAQLSAADAVFLTTASPNALPVSVAYNFTELKLDDSSPQTKSEISTGASTTEKSIVSGAFDERLLKDLIETYGEFAGIDKTTPDSRPTLTSLERKMDPLAEPPPAGHPRDDASTALIVAPESKFSELDAAHRILSSMSEQDTVPSPSNRSSLPAKTRGEIDQQLKNIIKDYGEVDLYSHGKSLNTNVKVIAAAAVALLVLVLVGFIFFKTASFSSSTQRGPSAEPFIPSAASVQDAAQKK